MKKDETKTLMIGLTPPLEGGSERHIYELSSRLEECKVLTQKGSMCKNKIEIPVLKSGQFPKSFSFLLGAFLYSLLLLITPKKKFKVVHIHENLCYFLAVFLKLRYKIVITVHGMEGFRFYDNKRLWFLFRLALGNADTLIAVNEEDKKLLSKYFDNIVYIPNGVDLSVYGNIKPKVEKKISFIGRIHEQKGIIYLLEAFDRIKDKMPGFKLEIIGKVEDYGTGLQKKFGDKRIVWKGFMSDRREIVKSLKSAYCIVLPSLWEGLPLTLFEALASGRPVIVSDIAAFKSVINDEAIFFKCKDSGDLADKIKSLIKSQGLAKIKGLSGAKLAKNYDWNEIARKLNKVYNEDG